MNMCVMLRAVIRRPEEILHEDTSGEHGEAFVAWARKATHALLLAFGIGEDLFHRLRKTDYWRSEAESLQDEAGDMVFVAEATPTAEAMRTATLRHWREIKQEAEAVLENGGPGRSMAGSARLRDDAAIAGRVLTAIDIPLTDAVARPASMIN